MKKKKACIILPTYNEAKNIPVIIPLIFEQEKNIDSHEIYVIVVDDYSPDGTRRTVENCMKDYQNLDCISGEKKGLGEAYKRGINYATNKLDPDLIFEMDADLQHDPKLIPLFIQLSKYGFSLVIGSRFAPGGATTNFSAYRKILSLLGNWLIRLFGGLPRIHDCTSGYRCIKVEILKKCDLSFLSTRGYSFQSSLLFELLRHGARVIEVPIIFGERIYGVSKLKFQDQLEFLLNLVKIRFRKSQEFIKFGIVGFTGIFVNLGLYYCFTRIMSIDYELSAPIAIELSIIWNFVFNNILTFKNRINTDSWPIKFYRFHIVAGLAGLCNYTVFLLLLHLLNIWDLFAIILGILFGTIVNYSLNSIWTWKKLKGNA